jgi:hypothetical protein
VAWANLSWLEMQDVSVASDSMKLQIGIFAKSVHLKPPTLKIPHVAPIDIDSFEVFGDS